MIADGLQHLPREYLRDMPKLLIDLARHARALRAVALDGFEAFAATRTTPNPPTPFLGRAKPDARAVAEAVFWSASKPQGDQVGTVVARKGRSVPVVVRQARAAGQMQFHLAP